MKPSWTTSLLVASLLSCAGACTTHVGVGPLDEETGNARQEDGILTDGNGNGDGDDSSKDDAGVSEEPTDDDESSEENASEEPEEPAQDACDGVGTAAYEVLSARCGGCHDAFPGMGSFSDVLFGARPAHAKAACARVKKARESGQVRAFTGNEYAADLAAGNISVAIAWSGDIQGLAADNPDLKWIAPKEGAMLFSDNMMIPKSSDNVDGAHAWLDWCYDPAHSAQIVAAAPYISAVQGALEQVRKLLLGRHIESCVADALRSGSKSDRQQKIEELLDVFARFGAR